MSYRVKDLINSAEIRMHDKMKKMGYVYSKYRLKCRNVRYKKHNILYSDINKIVVCDCFNKDDGKKDKIGSFSFVGNLETGRISELKRIE